MTVPTETAKEAARRLSDRALRNGYRPEALHEYTNAIGATLFHRIRLKHPVSGDKWIRPMQRTCDGYALGEPPPGTFPQGKPLYHLRALTERATECVIVTEGEHKADKLAALGLLVTTSGGADSAANADWGPLGAREVMIWPDNDDAGNRYAADVATRLSAIGCIVRTVDVAALGLEPKGDAADWLAMHPKANAGDVLALPSIQNAESVTRSSGSDSICALSLDENQPETTNNQTTDEWPESRPLLADSAPDESLPTDGQPLRVADWILRNAMPRAVHWQEAFYQWRAGVYAPVELGALRQMIYEVLDRANSKPTARKVSDVLDAMRACAHLDGAIRPPQFLDGSTLPPNTLVLRNGLLDLATGALEAHTPRLFALSAAAVDYHGGAGKPIEWVRFLESLWGDDRESIETLQEIIGYLLSAETVHQKIFLLVGPMRLGKGTIFRIVTALAGAANVAAPTLGSLADQFGLQQMIGKSVALVSDARLSGRADQSAVVERLLSVSGEDSVSVARKFKTDHTAPLGARFVIATNELPRLLDSSGALASRFVTLVLKRSFLDNEDHNLTARLLCELPAILLWAIQGLRRLTERGRFIQPTAAADARRLMADIASPTSAFLRDQCHLAPGASIAKDSLWQAWLAWCVNNGRDHAGTKASFARDLMAVAPGIAVSRPEIGGARVQTYQGIGLGPSVRARQGDGLLHAIQKLELRNEDIQSTQCAVTLTDPDGKSSTAPRPSHYEGVWPHPRDHVDAILDLAFAPDGDSR